MKLFILFLFFPLLSLFAETFCYFIPPSDWECADPSFLSSHVEVGFFGKGATSFHPSINLAIEEVGDISLKEYVKIVKEIHQSDRATEWRDLGKFKTAAGTSQLTEITTQTRWGEIRMLQLLMVANKKAYVLTGAMAKEEFALFRNPIIKSFRSLSFTTSLIDSVADPVKQAKIKEAYAELASVYRQKEGEDLKVKQKTARELLQKCVLNECKEMGAYFQIVLLKELFASLPK